LSPGGPGQGEEGKREKGEKEKTNSTACPFSLLTFSPFTPKAFKELSVE
jgi:hypothetical protein